MKVFSIFSLLPLAFCTVWTLLCQEKKSTGPNQPAQTDQIEVVGRKYHLDAVNETTVITTITAAGRLLRTTSDNMKYELSADVITLAMSPDNWATRKRFTVLESRLTRGGQSAPILPAGTTVEVSIVGGKNVYQVGDKQVEDEAASALENLITLHTAPVSDEEMLGTDKQRKVGETWKVNADAIRKELDGIDAQGGVISGEGSLEQGPNNSRIVKSWFEVQDVLMPISPEFDKQKGAMSVEYSRETPLAFDQTRVETHSLHIVRVGIPKRNKDAIFSIVTDEKEKFAVRPITSEKKDVSSSPD
jgi:hypothetical protein